jgi:TonB family protein
VANDSGEVAPAGDAIPEELPANANEAEPPEDAAANPPEAEAPSEPPATDEPVREETPPPPDPTEDAPADEDAGDGAEDDRPGRQRPIRVSSDVLESKATRRAFGSYTREWLEEGARGPVQVAVLVSESGEVLRARAVSGHPLLHDQATRTARGWRFSPTVVDGSPVKVFGTIRIPFRGGRFDRDRDDGDGDRREDRGDGDRRRRDRDDGDRRRRRDPDERRRRDPE